jgi:BlaI family transcriptional regulator, penicillinase repressor
MAKRPREGPLTPAELEIMNILWDHGPATVQAVVGRLSPERPLAYTTVQTVLNVLHRKGKVTRIYKNRAYHYKAGLSRARNARSAIRGMVASVFGGAPEQLVLAMVESEQLTPEQIENLQRLLDGELDRRKGLK